MPQKPRPALIGAFVIGAFALVVVALFIFGAGGLFRTRQLAVTYFHGSVGGLVAGAPVTFRGVRVGAVSKVTLRFDSRTLDARIPVYLEFDPERLTWTDERPSMAQFRDMVDKGLRAKLSMQSVVTGQMAVELDFLPGTPAVLLAADRTIPEIPSVESALEELRRTVTELPLRELADTAARILDRIDKVVASPEAARGAKALAATLTQLEEAVTTLNQQMGPISRSAEQVSGSALQTLQDLRRLIGDVSGQIGPAANELRATLKAAGAAAQQAQATLVGIQGAVAATGQSRQDLDIALANLADASRSLRSFAETIERSPNALLTGR